MRRGDRHLQRACATWMCLATFAACAPDDTAPPVEPPDTIAEDTAAGPDSDVVPPAEEVEIDGLVGVAVDPDDAPVAGASVLCCTLTSCLVFDAGPDGRFRFPAEPGTRVAVKTHADLDAEPRHAVALLPVALGDVADVDVGALYAPALSAGLPIGDASAQAQSFAVAEGLELTLRTDALRPAFGERLRDLAAGRVPDRHLRVYPGLEGEDVLATFALHPFDAHSDAPIGVRVALPIPAGASVRLRTIGALDGALSEPVDATSDGAWVATRAGEGITELTWLVVSAPSAR
jgi:hypothetical protein